MISAKEARQKVAEKLENDKYMEKAIKVTLDKIEENIKDEIKEAKRKTSLNMYHFMDEQANGINKIFSKVVSYKAVIERVIEMLIDLGYEAWLDDLTIRVKW